MQREKGARGERELSKEFIRLFGCDARRGQQYEGSSNSPDVVTSIEGIQIECKRTEALSLYKAMEQAIKDSGDDVPLVCHRRSNKPWLAIVRLNDLGCLVNALKDHV